ncbi:hypothetical protein ACU4GD_44990 [Cupriavidus basilensis]
MLATLQATPPKKQTIFMGLYAAAVVLIGILVLPLPADLPVAGHRMPAILALCHRADHRSGLYEASAIMITSLMAALIGFAPTVTDLSTHIAHRAPFGGQGAGLGFPIPRWRWLPSCAVHLGG